MVRELLKKAPFAEQAYQLLKNYRSKREKNLANKEFKKQFELFVSLSDPARFNVRWEDRYPILNEKTEHTSFDRHYIYHTAWAARCLAETKPAKHVDISSLLFFSAITSAFVPTDFYDFRPADIVLKNLSSRSANLTKLLFETNSIPSLSCMHTVEHIGLGRYGDEIDPDGDMKAIRELERVLAPGGNLFFVVPVGKDLLRFNAHRVYSYDQVVNAFSGLTLKSFSLITEDFADGGLIDNPSKAITDSQDYGCGCFWFTK